MSDNAALDTVLAEAFSHLRDVSTRDGVQSWDGNLWKIDDVLSVVKELDRLAQEVGKVGGKLPPAEVWGGGQVLQPAMYLYEDPLINLEKIKEAAPNLDLQCLYRGRQCFGFIPVSNEVQGAAIDAALTRGMKVFRIFDMMNDMQNVETGINILKRQKQEHPDAGIVIEGAISYISEPEGGKRAWKLDEYADYAVKLAQAGCDEIAIKNYAGVGDTEMVPLIKKIHEKLAAAGFEAMAVNLHTHGAKKDLLCEAVNAGAGKVDVAIGELSDGPSHSNMRAVVNGLLQDKGFTQEEIDAHPVMQQLAHAEDVISSVVHRKDIAKQTAQGMELKSFDEQRGPLKQLSPEAVERYRMAGGAFSYLWALVQAEFPKHKAWAKPEMKHAPKSPKELFDRVLETSIPLWEKAGRFNTVTPGAKILTDQAIRTTIDDIYGVKPSFNKYMTEYLNIATGRFGANQGLERGVGDVAWRDAVLIYNALGVFNKALDAGEVTVEQRDAIVKAAQLKLSKKAAERSRISWMQKDTAPGIFSNDLIVVGKPRLNIENPDLEMLLTDKAKQDPALRTRLIDVVKNAGLPDSVRNAMVKELTPGRSPTPSVGVAEGARILQSFGEQGIDVAAIQAAGKPISSPEDMALLAILLRQRTPDGTPNDSVVRKMLEHHAGIVKQAAPEAQTPPAAITKFGNGRRNWKDIAASVTASTDAPSWPGGGR